METDAVAGDHMEIDGVEEGGSNTDLTGRCADSDDDSYTKTVIRRMSIFPYEIPSARHITDYTESPYPWEKDAKEEGPGARRRGKEEESTPFLKVKFMSWPHLPDGKRNREGHWDELLRARIVKRKMTADSPLLESVADPCPEVYSPLPLCSAEVLAVRLEMCQCFEKGVSCRRLFKSKADVEELRLDNDQNEPYFYRVMCHRSVSPIQASSYSHFFPKPCDLGTICFDWIKPTTLEGDKQYVKFFPILMEATEYGQTKDHVLAKAIVLARKSFQKMLFFQIDIAVENCMELLEYEERMNQRYYLYYSVVGQIILNGKDCKSLVKSIKAGESGLAYHLTEFGVQDMHVWEGVIENIVDYLVSYLRYERECGLYMEWVYDKPDKDLVRFVFDTIDEQFQSSRPGLYVDFLIKKMELAEDIGFVPPEITK